MRTFSLVLLGLAVGAALLSRSPSRTAPTPPEPAASAPALADLETLEFWEQGSYIQPISRTCLTRTPEGTRVELELYHEEAYQEQAGPELLEQAKAILEEYGVGGWAGFSGFGFCGCCTGAAAAAAPAGMLPAVFSCAGASGFFSSGALAGAFFSSGSGAKISAMLPTW